MDHKKEIISNLINLLIKDIDQEMIDKISDALEIVLYNYNVSPIQTEVQLYDGGFSSILKKFIVCKQIEGASDRTLKRYYSINLRMLEGIGKPITEITTDDIRVYMAALRMTGSVSNRTLDGMRLCYSSFFSWASSERIIKCNPLSPIKQIKWRKQIKKPFSSVELAKIREACDNKRDLALIDFLATTGVRVSECVSVDIADIDFQSNELIVLGKGNKERKVYISEIAALHINDYLSERTDKDPALFFGHKGRLSPNGIQSILRRIGNRAGVSNVHPHRFRRTIATSLINRGMDILAVAELLGHADIRTTQIYCTVSQSNVKNSFQKFTAA